MSSNSFTIPYLDGLLPSLRLRAELIFAAYPNLDNLKDSRYAILETLSLQLRRLAEIERALDIFTSNHWQQLSAEKYQRGAWTDPFYLRLKKEANPEAALAEIKERLRATNAGAWFSNPSKPNEITLSGSRREVLNQLGIQGAWLDKASWPITPATLTNLIAVAEAEVEHLLGNNLAALDLILNSDV